MDLVLSETQQKLGNAARAFAEETLNKDLEARDARGTYDDSEWRKIWTACADQGLIGLCAPREFGGGGHDPVTAAAILHEVGYGCRDNGITLALNSQIWTVIMPILEFGTPAQKSKLIGPVLRGECIGADAVTEAEAGSDAMALTTTAKKTGDGYILNGEKVMIGLAAQ